MWRLVHFAALAAGDCLLQGFDCRPVFFAVMRFTPSFLPLYSPLFIPINFPFTIEDMNPETVKELL
jgi:hypothetical protein